MTRNRDRAFFERMVELAMTALAADLKPTIVLNETKHFADFHSVGVAAGPSMVKSVLSEKLWWWPPLEQ